MNPRSDGAQNAALFYYAASIFALFLIPGAKLFWHETNLPPLVPQVRLVINLLYLNLAAAFFILARRFAGKPLPRVKWWAIFFLIAVGLCVIYPVFSGDLMEYLVRGRILGVYHQSPYQHVPAEFPSDLLYAYSTWKINPDCYGPLLVALETIPALFFANSVTGMVWLEKMIFLGFMAFGAYFFTRLASEFGRAEKTSESTVLFALNPLLWVSTVIDGHNDIVMLSLTLAGVYFFMRKKFTHCFLLCTAAFLAKYTVLLILPFLVIAAMKQEGAREGKFPWAFAAKQIILNSAVVMLAFWPLWGGKGTFLALIRASGWFYTNTIPYAVHQGFSMLGLSLDPAWFKYGFVAVFFAVYAYWLWIQLVEKEFNALRFFRRLCLVYLCFYLTIISPFGFQYLLWALPWLILSHWPFDRFLIIGYAFAGLFSYFKRMNYLLLLACAVYFAALAVQRMRTSRQTRRMSV